MNLLAYEFKKFELPLALSLIDPDRDLTSMNRTPTPKQLAAALTPQDLNVFLSPHDLNRLELYARNMVDHHMVLDLMPTIARLLFCGRLPTLRFAFLQIVIMLGVGLQHRSIESLSEELQLPANQVLAFFNKCVRKLSTALRGIVEEEVAGELPDSVIRAEKYVRLSRCCWRCAGL